MLKASDVASSNKIFLNKKFTETFYAVVVEVDDAAATRLPPTIHTQPHTTL